MTKGIFDVRTGSGYDDDIVERYHFPNRYLPTALRLVGDWIVYRGSRRGGGRSGYLAAARVVRIDPDPAQADHSYARMADFLPFDAVVPLEGPSGPYEAIMRAVSNPGLRGSSIQGRSVRPLDETDFAAIVGAGLRTTLASENAVRLELVSTSVDAETRALVEALPEERERRIVQVLVNRKIREASFRGRVLDAYDGRCAVTGIRMVNGGGRTEAQAAHIWPVVDGGPDVVRNGIALSATVHWCFDRHLLTLTDKYGLLVSHNRIPGELRSLFERQMQRIHLPLDRNLWPHPAYMARHREMFFDKGEGG
ncbi:MAG: HNH endonuclease [Janthinobacterium lividum]